MKDVTMPTGITTGKIIVLPTVSDNKSSSEPKRAERGIKNLWSPPATSLTIWGLTSPIKPDA